MRENKLSKNILSAFVSRKATFPSPLFTPKKVNYFNMLKRRMFFS